MGGPMGPMSHMPSMPHMPYMPHMQRPSNKNIGLIIFGILLLISIAITAYLYIKEQDNTKWFDDKDDEVVKKIKELYDKFLETEKDNYKKLPKDDEIGLFDNSNIVLKGWLFNNYIGSKFDEKTTGNEYSDIFKKLLESYNK